MKKNIFFTKKKNFYYFLPVILFILISIYFILFYLNINKSYFQIKFDILEYYFIPDDKEGEKVKFLDKKSLNNIFDVKDENKIIFNTQKLDFTIQLFSDPDFMIIKNFMNKYIEMKSELINIDELFLFSIETDIGIDYFLSYKNFSSKEDAINFCKNSLFFDKCLILNLKND